MIEYHIIFRMNGCSYSETFIVKRNAIKRMRELKGKEFVSDIKIVMKGV